VLRFHVSKKPEPVIEFVRADAEHVVAKLLGFLTEEHGLLALGLLAQSEQVTAVDDEDVVGSITNGLVKGGPPGQPA
jgi:hypothetical protein